MPPELVARKVFRKRQPCFAMAAVGLVLVMLSWWVYFHKMSIVWDARVKELEIRRNVLDETNEELQEAVASEKAASEKLGEIVKLSDRKSQWLEWINGVHDCLLDGMWLRSLKPVTKNGSFRIEISGRGFEDSLRKYDSDKATAIEVFRDRLRGCEHFSDETQILNQRDASRGAYVREFTILVAVKGLSEDKEALEGEE